MSQCSPVNNNKQIFNFAVASMYQVFNENKIIGILGFIPTSQFSNKLNFKSAAWLSFWKNNEQNKAAGLGFGMIDYLKKKVGIKDILNIGLNNRVVPLFKYLNYNKSISVGVVGLEPTQS